MKSELKGEFILFKVEKMLRDNGLHLTRKECAESLGVNYSTIGLYLRENGVSFHALKSKIRFEKADEMLAKDCTDFEFEEALGFDDSKSLDAFLRRHKKMGLSTYKRIYHASNKSRAEHPRMA